MRNINLDSHFIQHNKFWSDFVNPESSVKINKHLKTKMGPNEQKWVVHHTGERKANS